MHNHFCLLYKAKIENLNQIKSYLFNIKKYKTSSKLKSQNQQEQKGSMLL